MIAHFNVEPYKTPLLFLGVAGVVVPLFRRLKLSPVLGFLLAGILIGPNVFGRIDAVMPFSWPVLTQSENVETIAGFGVVFLMFNIGLELSLERLALLRKYVFGLGPLQLFFCGAALFLIARALGLNPPSAILVGAALALSSTAIVVPVLAEKKRLNTLTGRAVFSVLLFQDLMVAPLLFMAAMLAEGPGATTSAFWSFAPAVVALAAIVGIGRLVLRPLFQLVAATGSTELFMAACLLVVIATAVAAASAGLSMALGAFIAGLLLAETEFRRAIEIAIDPFKGLLLGLFFVSVGAGLDPYQIFVHPVEILGVAFGLVAVKAPIVALVARPFGLKSAKALEAGLLLGPGGEFAFIILSAAIASGALPHELGDQIFIGVTLSMMMIPALAAIAARAGAKKSPMLKPEPPVLAPARRAIIIGYGRVGQMVADLLKIHNIDYICIEGDAHVAAQARERGEPVYWGDGANAEFLAHCGLADARALIATMHSPSKVDAVVRLARSVRADLTIFARARDAAHARALYKLGVTDAVPETIEASLQLAEAALVEIGVPMGLVIASIHEQRDVHRRSLIADESQARRPQPFRGRRQKR